ncbi:MAG TPA: hypothetical protein EYP35_02490 [Desulfobacterales bacterium]|nr:hypothetical protein [Desulfobacterales bacterium]
MISQTFLKKNREQGFVLVTAMVFLLALTLLGILAVNNSSFERLLGGNERLQVGTFYEADSGIGAAIGLLGMNIELKGFTSNEAGAMRGIGFDTAYNATPTFYMSADTTLKNYQAAKISDLNGDGNIDDTDEGIFFGQNALGQNGTIYRDAFYPRNPQLGSVPGQLPTTSLKITAHDTTFSAGNAIQSNEGYHGLGAGVASGGAEKIYDIRSRHDNINNAVAQMHIQWRHVIK